jgi:hypothetical protein
MTICADLLEETIDSLKCKLAKYNQGTPKLEKWSNVHCKMMIGNWSHSRKELTSAPAIHVIMSIKCICIKHAGGVRADNVNADNKMLKISKQFLFEWRCGVVPEIHNDHGEHDSEENYGAGHHFSDTGPPSKVCNVYSASPLSIGLFSLW